ncbi:MAG: DNA-directed RNA polymerase sigma-70 factor [Cyclobacteriaceae bacterium]|nr:MAG: DNA-directed RNA polymerase sigma-70 factor [Cyclobacteriaceae bacterium]
MSKGHTNIEGSSSPQQGKQIIFNEYIQQQDEELWSAFKQGSLIAYKFIYEQNIDPLFQYGNSIIADSELVADCVQDLFVDLYRRRSNLGEVHNIKGYLLISFRRRLFDSLKKQKKNLHVEQYGFEILMSESIGEINLADEKKESIRSALNLLSYQRREAIYLRFFNDLSCADIGKIMGIKTQSVYNLLSSGLKTIKETVFRNI